MPADDPNAETLALRTEPGTLMRQATIRLEREFEGTFDAETIERYIADSQAKLATREGFATDKPLIVEQFTRDRLKALARLEVDGVDRPSVLFLCVHNAGRSQMAAGWLRHFAGERVEVFSGGSNPGAETNSAAVSAMAEVGIDISTEHPKPWTDEIARAADVIVTMGCGDACPVYLGKRFEDWELVDPAGQPIEVVRRVRDDIRARVEALVDSLELTHT